MHETEEQQSLVGEAEKEGTKQAISRQRDKFGKNLKKKENKAFQPLQRFQRGRTASIICYTKN